MLYDSFLTYTHATGDQLYALCPFHTEKTPSFTVNRETREWYCHGCGVGGAEKEFIQRYYDVALDVASYAFKQWEKKNVLPFPTQEQIDKWHAELLKQTKEVEILHSWGFTDEVIEQLQLGYEDLRIVFPIKSKTGFWVNARKYLPPHRRFEGEKNAKCLNIRHLGEKRYYPYEAFEDDSNVVFIVEGEKDCVAARSQGYNAVTSTGGSAIPVEEIYLFKGKTVYLMLDTDSVGKRNVKNYVQLLRNIAQEVYIVDLPCKDYADFYQEYGDADVMEYAQTLEMHEAIKNNKDVQNLTLVRSEFTEHLNMWVKLNNMSVIGVEPKIYTVPTKLKVLCRNDKCSRPCSLSYTRTTELEVDIRQMLRFIDSSDNAQDSYLRNLYGCKSVQAVPTDFTNIQKIIFQESASFIDGLEEASFENRYGIFMYNDFRLQATLKYNFEACRVTDPRNQQNYYVIRSAEAIANVVPTIDEEVVQRFRDIGNKYDNAIDLINHHYNEWIPALAIEGRPDLFGALLLTYCSVTEIPWQAGILKGWLDTMVIGDTRTGKSQMAQRMVKLLGMGGYINGENARSTGVIGGVQRFGDSWVVTWGAIPMNDRGLLVIDEASGLEIEDVKNLSSTRSSGAVTLNKIVKGEARARTRLVWLSNPRSGRNIADFYWRGYGAFQEYIPVVEDQARYDLVLTAARDDVEVLDGVDVETPPNIDTWCSLFNIAWTIKSQDIVFPKDFKIAIRQVAKDLNEIYGGGPLVVGVAVHEKLLRLTCAFGILCGEIYDGKLKVSEKHLNFAKEFLILTLEKPSFGYSDYIKEFKRAQKKKEENVTYVRALLTMHPVLRVLLSSSGFKGYQFQEILGIDKLDSSKILSELITRGLLRPTAGANYIPDKMLMDIAKQMEV